MNVRGRWWPVVVACAAPLLLGAQAGTMTSAAAPLILDHNRMFVDGEVQARDGTWRRARLWIDTGNPEFMMSEAFARALGFDLPAPRGATGAPPGPVPLPHVNVRLSGVPLEFQGLNPTVRLGARQWATMAADANLPSTVLRRYRVAFDYPKRRLELGPPGSAGHRGAAVPARVHSQTGIVQVDTLIAGERVSFAIDIGASYSFVSGELLASLASRHADWPRVTGAFGCANIWGVWPEEERWPVLRIPQIQLGTTAITGVGLVGLPNMFGEGANLGTWYSQRTAVPVAGFLGPNAFKGFRLEIDYEHGAIYLERAEADDVRDMDLVGLTLQPEGGRWRVIGAAVEGVERGDILLEVDGRQTSGATMGAVVDALRGEPGDLRILTLERLGRRVRVEARVRRHLPAPFDKRERRTHDGSRPVSRPR